MSVPADGPTIHGVYNYWLGGSQHKRADRELGAAIAAKYPGVPAHIRAAQEFHLRTARWAAGQGITRFVHAGNLTALPRGRNVHDAAREIRPDAEVVYAYRDAGAHAMSGGLLAGRRGLTAVLSGQGGFLASEPAATWAAEGRPVCVIAGLMLHFTDGERAAKRIARAAGALPPGSVLAASVAIAADTDWTRGLLGMFTPGAVYRHTAEDVVGWLAGAGLEIVGPGLTDVRVVPGAGPGRPGGEPPDQGSGYIAGVLGRKP